MCALIAPSKSIAAVAAAAAAATAAAGMQAKQWSWQDRRRAAAEYKSRIVY